MGNPPQDGPTKSPVIRGSNVIWLGGTGHLDGTQSSEIVGVLNEV